VGGVADSLKGQMPLAFARSEGSVRVEFGERPQGTGEGVMETVDRQLAPCQAACGHFVSLLPKTRSGKTLRRSIQALAEGRDPGDLTTIEDPAALEQI